MGRQRKLPLPHLSGPKAAGQSRDVYIYSDSTQLFLSALLPPEDPESRFGVRRATEAGLAMSLEFVQDDSFVARFRLGNATTQEEDEWVGRAVGRLNLVDGRLCCNGVIMRMPPGEYLAEVSCYLPNATGWWCLERAGKRRKEPCATYWRRTRPGQPMPGWLAWACRDRPTADPGHEHEWETSDAPEPGEADYVEIVVRLMTAPRARLALSRPRRDGWLPWTCRRPQVCPQGLRAIRVRDAGL